MNLNPYQTGSCWNDEEYESYSASTPIFKAVSNVNNPFSEFPNATPVDIQQNKNLSHGVVSPDSPSLVIFFNCSVDDLTNLILKRTNHCCNCDERKARQVINSIMPYANTLFADGHLSRSDICEGIEKTRVIVVELPRSMQGKKGRGSRLEHFTELELVPTSSGKMKLTAGGLGDWWERAKSSVNDTFGLSALNTITLKDFKPDLAKKQAKVNEFAKKVALSKKLLSSTVLSMAYSIENKMSNDALNTQNVALSSYYKQIVDGTTDKIAMQFEITKHWLNAIYSKSLKPTDTNVTEEDIAMFKKAADSNIEQDYPDYTNASFFLARGNEVSKPPPIKLSNSILAYGLDGGTNSVTNTSTSSINVKRKSSEDFDKMFKPRKRNRPPQKDEEIFNFNSPKYNAKGMGTQQEDSHENKEFLKGILTRLQSNFVKY